MGPGQPAGEHTRQTSRHICPVSPTSSGDRAVLHQLVVDGVEKGLEAGVDDVGRNAHRQPAGTRRRIVRLDQNAGHGLRAAREDTHLVVDELDALDVLLIAAEIAAERAVERVHRAIAFAHRPQRLLVAVDEDLDDGLRHGDQLARANCGAAPP